MAHVGSTRLGGHAFNHGPSSSAEAEYDRLRGLARQEQDKKSSLSSKAHNAYERGDGGEAHELSEQAKRHAQLAEQYNKQASDHIFRENNAVGRVDGDTIDLHGQFVEEAEDILEQRIRYAQSTGQTHLHVIVGKGNHSPGHIQKIKPRVEQVCRELGLQYSTEANAGRMYVNLQGGPAHMPQQFHAGGYQEYHPQPYGQQYQGQPQYQQQQYPQQPYQQQQQQQYPQQDSSPGKPQQQFEGGNQQQHDQNEEYKRKAKKYGMKYGKKYGPKILRKLKGECCVVM